MGAAASAQLIANSDRNNDLSFLRLSPLRVPNLIDDYVIGLLK
jgi:hypothetical protein